jgi:hypothetical protein
MANIAIPSNKTPRRIENGKFADGRVHTVAANLSQNDTMDVAVVPAGARVLAIKAKTDTAISSGTIDIGTTSSAEQFGADVTFAVAETVASAPLGMGDVLSTTADTTIRIRFNSAAAPAATDVITAWVEMTMDDFPADSEAAA